MASLLATWCSARGAQVAVAIDWLAPTGAVATPLHYGLNAFHGYNPAVSGTPGNANYKANTSYMHPGIVRFHHGDQSSSSANPRGWIINPTTDAYQWDEAKINNAFSGAYPYGPTAMMTIVEWPAFLNVSASDPRLAPAHYADFAAFCAKLVWIVNVRQGRGVKYWEITNERESHGYWTNMDEVARIYAQAAAAMKAVDPTIKVGGPAFGSPEVADHLTKFIGTARALEAPLDFISYHSYPNFNGDAAPVYDTPDSVIWDQATALGTVTTGVRNAVAAFYPNPDAIELFQDEYNINWRINFSVSPSYDPRMNNAKGAVWDALAMIAVVQADATGAMAWNEADLVYGKLANGTYAPRPSAHVYHLFNHHLTGEGVAALSSDASKVVALAVREGSERRLALVNRAGTSQRVIFSFAGWHGPLAPETKFILYQVAASGLVTTTVSASSLTQEPGLLLPEDSVSVLTVDETAFPSVFESWISQSGAKVEDSKAGDDPDNDGLTNLLEFIFDTNPMSSNESSAVVSSVELEGETYPTLTFPVQRLRGEVSVTVRASTSLAFVDSLGTTEVSRTPETASTDTVVMRSLVPVSIEPTQFLRVEATLMLPDRRPGELPATFASYDLGAVSAAGSASFESDRIILRGAGLNIGGTNDQAHFVAAPLNGDGEWAVRVASVEATNPAAKAGLMVRASALPGAPEVSVLVTSGAGIFFRRRLGEGGATATTTVLNGAQVPVPFNWVKLVRSGATYTAYYSMNGSTWIPIGSDTVNWGPGGLVGLTVSSVFADRLCTATFTDFRPAN